MTSRNPDQVSSIAHTLLSTSPVGNATARMTSSVMSVATPDDFFGHAIHRPRRWLHPCAQVGELLHELGLLPREEHDDVKRRLAELRRDFHAERVGESWRRTEHADLVLLLDA
jgi:hypothetical protein